MFVFMLKLNNHAPSEPLTNSADNSLGTPCPIAAVEPNHHRCLVHSVSGAKPSPPSSISASSRRPSGSCPITLRHPPTSRRAMNGTNTNNKPPPPLPASELHAPSSKPTAIEDRAPQSDQPPPVPPRQSLVNSANKPVEGQFVRPGEMPIKTKRTIFRSRNVRRNEATTLPSSSSLAPSSRAMRSDSADALAVSSAEQRQRRKPLRRIRLQSDHEVNSD